MTTPLFDLKKGFEKIKEEVLEELGFKEVFNSNGFIADFEAMYFAGAKPVFVEIDPQNLESPLEDLKRKRTPKTKALILAQELFAILIYSELTEEELAHIVKTIRFFFGEN